MSDFHKKVLYALLLVVVIGIIFQSVTFTLILAGLVLAVAAEIDISLHRRDHDRRHHERRSGQATWGE